MEIAAYGGQKGYARLALGTAPMLLAWTTLGGMQPTMALVVQWAGFTTLWYADSKATIAGWSKYLIIFLNLKVDQTFSPEMVLTISFLPINSCGNLVCGIRSLCSASPNTHFLYSIIGSLAGCSYWGPVAGHGLLAHDLDLLREERKKYLPERQGVVSGDFEAIPADEEAERYTVVRKRKPEQQK
jgi:hypothetical protein